MVDLPDDDLTGFQLVPTLEMLPGSECEGSRQLLRTQAALQHSSLHVDLEITSVFVIRPAKENGF